MEGTNEVNDGRKACIDQKLCPRYRKKGKKVKGEVLTEFTQMTGYNRCYGAYLLRHQGKRIWLSPKGVAVGDVGKKAGGQRARKYDQKVLAALKSVWKILDYLCGKRLVAILPEVVPILERHGELKVDANTRERLIQISAATIDRLRLQINFFKPVMKMVAKQRRGSRIWKKYDVPKTPYRRICESPEVADNIKRELAQEHEKLNPAELARQIGWLQNCLLLKLTPEQKKRWEAGWM